MARNDTTSAIIDNILKITLGTGVFAGALVLPNLLIALEKPLDHYMKHLDKRSREREVRRLLSYMKAQKLLTENYRYGLIITKRGRKRLTDAEFNNLKVKTPAKWDQVWRLVFYDIPEKHKTGRNALTMKLRELGFYQLQRSAWIHPFPCKNTIKTIAVTYGLEQYVSYIKTSHIDNQQQLVRIFKKQISKVNF